MALLSPASRRYVITKADHGNYKVLGNVSPAGVGAWSVAFSPSDDWVGELTIVGRHMGKDPADDAAGFGTIAYIREQIDGAAADYELVPDTIYGDATILVPANGLTIGVAVICTQGTCTMYSQPLEGSPTPAFRGGAAL